MVETTKSDTFHQSLKFVLRIGKRENDILNKLTAKHTFAIRELIKIIQKEQIEPDNKIIRALTLPTKNQSITKYNLIELTGLSFSYLCDCIDTAVWLYKSYKAKLVAWEKLFWKSCRRFFINQLTDVIIESAKEITRTTVNEAVSVFIKSPFGKRLLKRKPKPPFESMNYKHVRKIPIFINNKNVSFYQDNDNMVLKVATLKRYYRLSLELAFGKYHLEQLPTAHFVGGQFVKNLKKKRWEFHAVFRKTIPKLPKQTATKKAIIGIDLGIATTATVVVLRERENLTKDCFYFLKESDIQRRGVAIRNRRKQLQRIITQGTKTPQVLEELHNLQGKERQLSDEMCNRITKKIVLIAKQLQQENYYVLIACGNLKGIRTIAQKGDGKGKKYRKMINQFPYAKLTNMLRYKCYKSGITKKQFIVIRENLTSKMCHKCFSTNTTRPTTTQFICKDCGLHYHADANGAINIALKAWQFFNHAEKDLETLAMIFLPRKFEGVSKLLAPHGKRDSPTTETQILFLKDSTGATAQLKVDEVGKVISGDASYTFCKGAK